MTILWIGGEIIAGAGLVSSHKGRWLLGLGAGLLGRCPLSASLSTEGVDRGVKGGEEVIWIEGADELVTLELLSHRVLEFGKHKGGAVGVEFLVKVGDHVGSGSVNVGHWLGGYENPERSWRGSSEAADLVAESAGVGEEQGCVESEDHETR